MQNIIEINGGLVSIVQRAVTHSMPLEDWLPLVEKRLPINMPVLPTGTRAVFWDPTNLNEQVLVVLVEQEPQIIHLKMSGLDPMRLSLPYVRFVFTCQTNNPNNNLNWALMDYRVTFSKSKYVDPTAKDMIRALVPNVYGDCRICFGSTGAEADQILSQRIDQTVNEFWATTFNNDLTIVRPEGSRTYRRWLRMTENNPTGWLEWDDFVDDGTRHTFYSFNDFSFNRATNIPARMDEMVANEGIPEIPLGATFGRVREWIQTLEPTQRLRILEEVLRDRALNNELYDGSHIEEDVEDDDEDA